MVETVITITVADLAILSAWERGQVLAAVGYVWDARAKNLQLAPIGKLPDPMPAHSPACNREGPHYPPHDCWWMPSRSPIEPGAIPEPVEAPREVPATPPAGAPGVDRPVDYSANIPGQASEPKVDDFAAGGSDSATSPDVPKTEPAGLATTMNAAETARWEAAMKAGVRVTDDGPPPAEVDDTPVPPAHKGGGNYDRTLVECGDCGKMFGRGAGMAAHKRSAHARAAAQRADRTGASNVVLDSRPPQPLPGERWQYTCDNCQRTFPGERTLEEHERTCGRKAS